MDINELRRVITKDMSYIPDFIKSTSFLDHAVWNNMIYINDIVIKLISDKVLTKSKIETIVIQFSNELELIGDIYDNIHYVNHYYNDLFEYLIELCINEERFEAAANINNFKEAYKNRYQF